MNTEHDNELVLHVWPGRWDLPTLTPTCLASILYLQLTIPGQFIVQECTNPDLSPDGQFPYLTQGLACVASFPAIVKYIEGRRRRAASTQDDDTEAHTEDGTATFSSPIDSKQRAQQIAWMAYISANLGDLVACFFFTLRHNYFDCVRPAVSEMFPAPQRYYVPDRIRDTYKPRLEAAGLWSVHLEEAEEEKRKKASLATSTIIQEAFGKEKVVEKAHEVFGILSRLLDNTAFVFGSPEPSALDPLLAAHILLLTVPPLPNNPFRSIISEHYPTLLASAQNLERRTLLPRVNHGPSASLSASIEFVEAQTHADEEYHPLQIRSASQENFFQKLSLLVSPFPWRSAYPGGTKTVAEKSAEEKEFDRMRWAWFGMAALGIVGWVWAAGIRIKLVKEDSSEDYENTADDGEKSSEEEEEEDNDDDADDDE